MYIQNNIPFLHIPYEEKALTAELSSENKSRRSVQTDVSLENKPGRSALADVSLENKPAEEKQKRPVALENFSEKALLVFESLTAAFSAEKKEEAAKALNSIGKAAAFVSAHGYESQRERLLVNQYFGNFNGVLSDDAIKKMILSTLGTLEGESREFLEKFSSSLEAPLQRINIRI